MLLHHHLAAATVCSLVLFVALLLSQNSPNHTSSQERNQTIIAHLEPITPFLPPDHKVTASFRDHGSLPKATPGIAPRMDSDGSDEEDDGNPIDLPRAYEDAAFKGDQLVCLMNAPLDQAAEMVRRSDKWRRRSLQSAFSDPLKEFKNWGWEAARSSLWTDLPNQFMASDFQKYGLDNVLRSLGVSTVLNYWYVAKVGHSKDWSMNGNKGPALVFQGRPLYWYQVASNGANADPSSRTLILPFMSSPSSRDIKTGKHFPPGSLLPDLKSCSDLVYLIYYGIARAMDKTIDQSGAPTVKFPAPRYIIIPGVSTPEVVALFEYMFKARKLELVHPPGHKWNAYSREGKALIGTPHGAAISFFLLQHKQQFGVKAIKSISLWNTERTEEERHTWHMWFEIGDPRPVSTLEFPDEHSDRQQSVGKGGDLLCMMEMTLDEGQKWASKSPKWRDFTVQSRFYDPQDAEKWGWTEDPEMPFLGFHSVALHFLEGLQLNPNDEDQWRQVYWEHTKAWTVDGRSGPAIPDAKYTSFFNYDKTHPVYVFHSMYSPAFVVAAGESPGPPPRLSRPSDMMFLQWYEHGLLHLDFPSVASKSRIPAPRHIYLMNVVTPEVVELLDELLDDEDDTDIEEPEGHFFEAREEIGTMLLGTRHGAAVCMFLITHKEQFGDQTVTGVRLFNGNDGSWHMDFEIDEVREGDPDDEQMSERDLTKARL